MKIPSVDLELRRPRLRSVHIGLRPGAPLLIEVRELLSFFGELLEQRRRLPPIAMLFVELRDAVVNLLEADSIGIPHWPAAVRREAVAVDIDDVDIDGAQRVTLFENAGAFVDQRVDAAVDDLFLRDRVLLDAGLGSPLADQAGDLGIGDGTPVLVILVPAGAGLLPVAAHLAELIFGDRLAHARLSV